MRGGGLGFEGPWPMGKMSGRAGGKKWGRAVKKIPLLKKNVGGRRKRWGLVKYSSPSLLGRHLRPVVTGRLYLIL